MAEPMDLRMQAACEHLVEWRPPWLDDLADSRSIDLDAGGLDLACAVIADVLDALDAADERPDVQAAEAE